MEKLREISKIARNVYLYKNLVGKSTMSENTYEALRLVCKHPGVNSYFLSDRMNLDKGLISRIVSSLTQDGYLTQQFNPKDKRSKLLFPTDKALALKLENEKEDDAFYAYIEAKIPEDKKAGFYEVLDILYTESKELRHHKFQELKPNEKSQNK
jgi:DNA-binding MarR family transcriptional regulator